MRLRFFSMLVLVLVLSLLAGSARADSLGTAGNFAVLAYSTVTNAGVGVLGATVITGNLGNYPGIVCTGFVGCTTTGPGTVNGTIVLGGPVALQAKNDLSTAYTTLGGLPVPGSNVLGGQLGGLTLGPGVYSVADPLVGYSLTGTLTLNDGGVSGSVFVFLMNSALITSPSAVVNVSGLSPTDSLFWIVRSSATLGTNTVFEGNILALTNIGLNTGATIGCGRALAENGQVTFDGQNPATGIENQISIGCAGTTGAGGYGFNGTSVPEPGSIALLGSGLFAVAGVVRRKLRK
jgi:Ice-binding-like/PEP-CTERM motif